MVERNFVVTCLLLCIAVVECMALSSECKVMLRKCCSDDEMLDAEGRHCIDAPWPNNASHHESPDSPGMRFDDLRPPYDVEWLNRWVPPGLPLEALGDRIVGAWISQRFSGTNKTYRDKRYRFDLIESVNMSALWRRSHIDFSRSEVLAFDGNSLKRPKSDGSFWSIDDYCVDAVEPPMGPYAVLRKCMEGECVWKCCGRGQLLASTVRGDVPCTEDSRGWWSLSDSPTLSRLGVHLPLRIIAFRDHRFYIHQNPDDELFSKNFLMRSEIDGMFSTWLFPCVDLYRDADGNVREVLGYLYFPRYARGIYKLTQNLSFLTVLLLAVALGSIASNLRMRVSLHGRALACHGTCLLLFNLMQVAYYLTISREVDKNFKIPNRLKGPCQAFGFTAYFLLTAASCWLTAVCVNMARGFRNNQSVISPNSKRSFRVTSVAAWGAAALLSVACVAVFAIAPDAAKSSTNGHFEVFSPAWYRPSLMETRTCYTEQSKSRFKKMDGTDDVAFYSTASVKWGTLLFYYAPAGVLVLTNVVALGLTVHRVQYLRRGNSLLTRDYEGTGQRCTSDPQGLMVYLKLLLSAGLLEMVAEVVAWGLTKYGLDKCLGCSYNSNYMYTLDHTLVYRAVGYCADFLRATMVLWLSAPERGVLRALWRRVRGKEDMAEAGMAASWLSEESPLTPPTRTKLK